MWLVHLDRKKGLSNHLFKHLLYGLLHKIHQKEQQKDKGNVNFYIYYISIWSRLWTSLTARLSAMVGGQPSSPILHIVDITDRLYTTLNRLKLETANHDYCWTALEKSSDRRGNEVKRQAIIKKWWDVCKLGIADKQSSLLNRPGNWKKIETFSKVKKRKK